MNAASWERLSGLTGVAFAVLIFAALLVQGVLPDANADSEEIADFFRDDRTAILVAIFLRFLAGFAFLWFAGTLRSALGRAEGGTGRLASVAFGSAIVFLASGAIANVALGAVALRADQEVDPQVASVLLAAAHFGYVAGGFALAWLLLATFAVVLRTRVFPAWLGWAGAAVALAAMIVGIAFVGDRAELAAHPFFVLWVLGASILIVRTPVEA